MRDCPTAERSRFVNAGNDMREAYSLPTGKFRTKIPLVLVSHVIYQNWRYQNRYMGNEE